MTIHKIQMAADGTAGGATPGALAAGGGTPAADSTAGSTAVAGTPAGAAPAAPAPDPFFKGLYDDDGKINKTAFDRLPDSLKAHKDLFAKYDSVDALLGGFANAHSMAVKKALAPLKGDEPPEIVAERKNLIDTINNVPKDPKGYGIKRPDDIPEMFWNEELAGQMAQWGVKNSISPAAMKEAQTMLATMTKTEIARGQQMEAEFFRQQEANWESTVHAAGLDLEKANELALRGAATLKIDPKNPIFKNAQVRAACLQLHQLVSEDKIASADGAVIGEKDNREMARDIMNNDQNPMYKAFRDPNHPDHDRVKQHVNTLYQTWKPRRG